jgi:hypothetical protein
MPSPLFYLARCGFKATLFYNVEQEKATELRMYEAELRRMRELVRALRYVMTLHAEDEMVADALNIFDVESVVLTGSIIERQKDRLPDEWKYLVTGETIDGASATVVAKFGLAGALVFITVFREE